MVNALKRAIYTGVSGLRRLVAPTDAGGGRRAEFAGQYRDGVEHPPNARAVLDRWANRRQLVPQELIGRIAPTRLVGINLRGVFRFPLERCAQQILPSQTAAKPTTNRASATDRRTNRNSLPDKRTMAAAGKRTRVNASLCGQARTVTLCAEIKRTPDRTRKPHPMHLDPRLALKSTGFPTSYVVVTPKASSSTHRVRDRHQTHDHSFDAAHWVTSWVDRQGPLGEVFTRSRKRSCNSQVETILLGSADSDDGLLGACDKRSCNVQGAIQLFLRAADGG